MSAFSLNCTRCERLAGFLAEVRQKYPDYHAQPVPSFGDPRARLLVVGLAPGMHGANATGRPFTGDHAGILLYSTLHANGFANQAEALAPDDGLELIDCRITNAVRCLPPQNKPTGAEVTTCNDYLAEELATIPAGGIVLALGGVAHRAVLKAFGLRQADYAFGHGNNFTLANGLRLLSSYHCSRYNTQTRRLTPAMFSAVFATARQHLDAAAA
ncbi:MAG: SPO1 DNA polymerase [Chromatiales bacterium]|jgi:uracil-DNA glycosylase family 4|nr:SPO1 DNA polymerase [Chromatiales bacterium]MDP6150653.1 uracil-DNA glycosylase [Gammaproteobacteria bacterium]MDP7269945.1 uracil-DNA glycosylase [Gammaproteobacteria bacterium]HJP05507.1 uracil-DNA glycosylase [Gammaproteobacteria bacterium]